MMLKKNILFVMVSVFLSTGTLAGEKVRMSTIAPGSSAYLVMSSFASAVNDGQPNYDLVLDATGTATNHMIDAAEGKIDLIMSAPNLPDLMRNQKAMFKNLSNGAELADNLRLLFWFPYGAYHVISRESDGLSSLDEIRGKSVFLGPLGGGAFNTAKRWIEATTGLVAGEDYRVVHASWSGAVQAFKEGRFEIYVNGGIPPFPAVEELAANERLRILGLSRSESRQMLQNNDTFERLFQEAGRRIEVIRAGAYGAGVTNSDDVFTIGTTVGVLARADLSDEAVYQMTKAFWERLDALQRIDPFMKGVTREIAFSAKTVKLHPGALRYYREAGWAVPSSIQ